MKYNLLVNYYIDKNATRSAELNFCILENISNPVFSNILVIASQHDYNYLMSICPESHKDKIIPLIEEKRPTYNNYFLLMEKHFSDSNNINIISNLDVIVPPETLLYSSFYLTGKSCLALTRWDISNHLDYKNQSSLYNTPDSQDTWIFKGGVNQINGADFTLGVAGCDNSIAYLLEVSGYEVKNPSKTLRTYHYHTSNLRNYTDIVGNVIFRLPPPYKLIHPTE